MSERHDIALAALDKRLKTLLPEQYQDRYEDVQPVSMGSAGLKLGADGKVAWNQMWATFCDLAMAGGPPHKGMLLEPAPAADVEADRAGYQAVVDEIARGIHMVTGLPTEGSLAPGWITIACVDGTMAEWLVRAMVMENVAARREGRFLDLPVGPAFRVEKEIKNVVTVMAKTCHYWLDHMLPSQYRAIAFLFTTLEASFALVAPAAWSDGLVEDDGGRAAAGLAARIHAAVGLPPSPKRYSAWAGVECPSVKAAVWLMRALVASNVLARREATTLFVPVDPRHDRERIVADTVARVHRLAGVRGVL